MKEIFGIIALTLSVGANIPYIIEIIKGQAQPHRISWLIWTLLGGVYFFSTIFDSGATLFTTGELIGPVVIFTLALRYGVGGKNKFEIYSLIVAIIAFALLFILEGVLISLLLALVIDGIGIGLTIKKIKADTDSESRAFWAIGALSAIFALLSLEEYVIVGLLFPVYVLFVSSYIFFISENNQIKPKAVRGEIYHATKNWNK
jgi:hypothetical protein